jgi:hypothetical protein
VLVVLALGDLDLTGISKFGRRYSETEQRRQDRLARAARLGAEELAREDHPQLRHLRDDHATAQ